MTRTIRDTLIASLSRGENRSLLVPSYFLLFLTLSKMDALGSNFPPGYRLS
jgi:hypothetical protein